MKIFSANNPPQAHIVCELLRSNNIDCEVRGEGLFGLQGELPFGEASEPYVWLLDGRQQEKAQALVAQFEQPQLEQSWHCLSCGEENEGQFGLCWQCGSPMSSAS
ncbi:DUF2007 domain-containing protein [Vibrio renipiscarius]|uniref:RanBP2-type domain-containing protein n=1 Tax=Vibrio renipiscarius TaxID=1461322 RepID=A0A0C2JGY4_9VIBR|nr:DUF2007 domain-containing protein [Vibrio renipiscarius]KII77094.1 hypothetical protein OJ16_13350 [Vibrio renipiscarius]KII77224.1 hypothetical protein PL18_16225 [Vibrio renipiscarius]